jgi:hypothetical protein
LGEVLKESHINWQGIFLKILIFFGEKRKYLRMLLLRGKKSTIKIDLGSHDLSIWREKITEEAEIHPRASRNGRQECLPCNASTPRGLAMNTNVSPARADAERAASAA